MRAEPVVYDPVRLVVDVAFLMQSEWKPEYRAVVEAAWHALRNWPVEGRMEAMNMRETEYEDTAHRITWVEK